MSLKNENIEKNRIIDDGLKSSGIVDSQLLASFDEAYNYDSASTINWLTAKIKILKEVVGNGGIVHVERLNPITDIAGLIAWLRERYPDVADKV